MKKNNFVWTSPAKKVNKPLYLVGESLNQNGDEKVEEDVVTERHQSHKVESSPVTGSLHPGEEDNVPVLLCQHLNTQIFLDLKYIKKKRPEMQRK